MKPAQIAITDLSYSLDNRTLLSIDSLSLSAHRIAVLGRNGSGKTTLARVLSGLIAPTTGTVKIGDVAPFHDRKKAIQTVGILFQNPDHQIIFPTVIEEIAFGLSQLGQTKEQARENARHMLARFDRSDWAERSISTLSQGQRHLVCLMAVLAMSPRVIILDEPFSGLDIPTKAALDREFAQIEQTLIHITHDTSTIENYDHVIWLEQGRVASQGSPKDVVPAYHAAMSESITL